MSIQDPVLKEIVQRLSDEFYPEKIFLLGSYTEGKDHTDYSLFILINESSLSKFERMDKAQFALRGIPAAVDVVVFTTQEFEDLKEIPGTLGEIVVREGVEIYI